MKENTQFKDWASLLYGLAVACGIAGGILRFSGSLEVGMVFIEAGILLALATGIWLGHLKLW